MPNKSHKKPFIKDVPLAFEDDWKKVVLEQIEKYPNSPVEYCFLSVLRPLDKLLRAPFKESYENKLKIASFNEWMLRRIPDPKHGINQLFKFTDRLIELSEEYIVKFSADDFVAMSRGAFDGNPDEYDACIAKHADEGFEKQELSLALLYAKPDVIDKSIDLYKHGKIPVIIIPDTAYDSNYAILGDCKYPKSVKTLAQKFHYLMTFLSSLDLPMSDAFTVSGFLILSSGYGSKGSKPCFSEDELVELTEYIGRNRYLSDEELLRRTDEMFDGIVSDFLDMLEDVYDTHVDAIGQSVIDNLDESQLKALNQMADYIMRKNVHREVVVAYPVSSGNFANDSASNNSVYALESEDGIDNKEALFYLQKHIALAFAYPTATVFVKYYTNHGNYVCEGFNITQYGEEFEVLDEESLRSCFSTTNKYGVFYNKADVDFACG